MDGDVDDHLSISAVSSTLHTVHSTAMADILEEKPLDSNFTSNRYMVSGNYPVNGALDNASSDTVAIHLRSSSFETSCQHRTSIPIGSYCRSNCDKCPKWGARECLFSRRQTSLAYCDLCPHYGKPGCIFGPSATYQAVSAFSNTRNCMSSILCRSKAIFILQYSRDYFL